MVSANGVNDMDFVSLADVAEDDIVALMNTPAVGRHLPLLTCEFSTEDCRAFLAAKQALWDTHGYGPWAFVIGGRFAGWGGLQPEQGDADFALVLHPDFWGWGRRVLDRVLTRAFGEMGLQDITILLPPGRENAKAVLRLGFQETAPRDVGGKTFRRFRLTRP